MRVVLDANLVVALFFPLPYSDQMSEHLTIWQRDRVELLAPFLLHYEFNNALHRVLAADWIPAPEAKMALQDMQTLDIRYVFPALELHERAWYWTDRLNHSKTYDAQYVALAELERADFWTADRRLANGAHQAGAGWVHWIGESGSDSL